MKRNTVPPARRAGPLAAAAALASTFLLAGDGTGQGFVRVQPAAAHGSHDHAKPSAASPRKPTPPAAPEAGHADEGHGHADHDHRADAHGEGEPDAGRIRLDAAQIAAAGIVTAPVADGPVARVVAVPGTVVPDAGRVARVAAKVVGTVAELRKRLGDRVEKGEVVAVLDSREVADAKNDYIAALVGLDLQEMLFARDHVLWDKKISAEQQFLRARSAFVEAQLKVDLTRQKLSALGVPDPDVASLAARPPVPKLAAGEDDHLVGLRRAPLLGLQRYNLHAPIAGRIIERRVDVGAPVNDEGQEKEIYTIADLSEVWVEMAVPEGDLVGLREGQPVALEAGDGRRAEGSVVFVSPMLDPRTRAAKVVAAIPNPDLAWRPGSFGTVRLAIGGGPPALRVPRTALQTIEGETVVFVRDAEGFVKRPIATGTGDAGFVAVTSGLSVGEIVATANTFVLKAELGKAEAEHSH